MNEYMIELVTRMQQGDHEAFEKIFEEYKFKAVRTAYLITNNKALAEDIAQEAFVQCYLKKDSLKDPAQFKSWFFKILTRIAWRSDTREKFVTPVEEVFHEGDSEQNDQVEQAFLERERADVLMGAIDQLEMKQKTVVLLYYYNEFSVPEIAKIMDCFEGTVKSRLFTARKKLKKNLEKSKVCDKEGMSDAILYKI